MNKFYITTAIAYTSAKPHIGNTYELILTDAVARFKRFMGYDVYFLTGADEHGQKIEELAAKAGVEPQQYVDDIAGQIREIADMLNISYDQFIRTSDPKHKQAVGRIFEKLYQKGDIYKGEYVGRYCTPCESFWTESQLDEEGKCPDCHREVRSANEEAYFLRMSAYQEALIKHIEDNPEFIMPESRKNEMLNSFIKEGITDLCVSRTSFKWGIPVSFDEGHIVYVWLDALSNYITALGYMSEDDELYRRYWPADYHIIGKDILRFHTIYWPIILMALEIPLPRVVFGHPWFMVNGQKMSKSLNNVIYADELVEEFGLDAVRYYLLREMPYGTDGNITREGLVARYNGELANNLGNLVNRTVAMTNKYFGGEIHCEGEEGEYDDELIGVCMESARRVVELMEGLRISEALESIIGIAHRANKYIDETEPWVLAKDEERSLRLKRVLYNLLEAERFIGVMLQIFMPDTAESIGRQVGAVDMSLSSISEFGKGLGERAGTAKPLFARIEK